MKYSRATSGIIASIIGAISNLLLSSVKIYIGIVAGSIAVLLDGMNNFVDTFSSGASAYGFAVTQKTNDKQYVNGYGRIEYIISFIISIGVFIVGIYFLMSSIERLLTPQFVYFSWVHFYIILATIFAKIVMGLYYRAVNLKVDSMVLKTLILDSYQDAVVTAFVLLSFVLTTTVRFPIDALCGIVIAIIIMVNCSKLITKSYRTLMGAVDDSIINSINELIITVEHIQEVEELRVFDYGHNALYASVVIRVNDIVDFQTAKDIIKALRDEIKTNFNIEIYISIR